jgi:hypothetical protein
MRNGLIGLLSATVLASTMATAGCGSSSSSDETGGTGASSSTGGAAGTGGSTSTGGAVGTGGSTSTGGSQAGVGGSGGDSFTTLSGTTALSALTQEEATQLCDEAYAYYGSAISTETFCKWKGLSFATSSSAPTEEQLRANCADKENRCLADPAAALADNSGCNSFPADCAATVADYCACVRDQAATFTQTVAGISNCDALTSEGTNAVWDALGAAPLASCTFSDTCPGLYPPNPLY